MSIEKKIIEEIKRHYQINNYVTEQDAPIGAPQPPTDPNLAPPTDLAATPQAPPPTDPTLPQEPAKPEIIDVEKDDEIGRAHV